MTADYQLQEITIKEESSGIPMITMCLPKEWATSIRTNRKTYNGFGEPMDVRIDCRSLDQQSVISYNSNYHYCSSLLYSTEDYSTDLDGRLFRKFIPIKDFLQQTVEYRLSANKNYQFIRYQDWPQNDELLKGYQKWVVENNRDPYTAVDSFYYKGGTIEYSLRNNESTSYRCVCSSIIEAANYTVVRSLPFEIQRMLNDPLSNDIGHMASSAYNDVRYDQTCGAWVYTADQYRDWYVSQMILMIMPEEQYADQYENIFLPVVSFGAHYTPQLQNEMESLQASIIRKKKEAMETAMSKQSSYATSNHHDEEERKRQRDWEAQEKLRKTREETAAIQNAMYENKQRSDAKIREMRNDTMMGYTRYSDRHGNEHVIHSTDRYAYRKGDIYVTSDRPLDKGYGWEELDKKKY